MLKLTLVGAVLVMALVGCGDTNKPTEESEKPSSASFNLDLGPIFAGNSVRIHGTRLPAADLKYPCLSEINTCYALDANGALFHVIEDLCPSENIPKAPWTFTYEIYSELGCETGTGELLNAENNPNNFVCYDIGDLFDRQSPNQSVEPLYAGRCNENEIVCITTNASKTFDFDVCVEDTDPCSAQPTQVLCPPNGDNNHVTDILRLDCGCVVDPHDSTRCVCAQGLDGLPEECSVLPANDCQVVCGTPTKIAAVRYRSFNSVSAINDDIFLGIGDVGVGTNRVQTGFVWASTTPAVFEHPVSFVYVPGVELQTDIGVPSVKTLEYPLLANLGSMDSFKVTISAMTGCEKVELINLELDGILVGTFTANAGQRFDFDFPTTLLNDGFTFEGIVKLTNCASTQENSKVEILVGRNVAALF